MWNKVLTKEVISPLFIILIAILTYFLIKQIVVKNLVS